MNRGKRTRQGRGRRRRRISWNIGTVIFAALFLYMLISLILYLGSDRIASYQVTAGPLSKNETVTALAMREETVVEAKTGGYVSYYAREYAKVKREGIVCGIGSTAGSAAVRELTENDLDALRTELSGFSRYYTENNFSAVYDFKYTLNGALLDDTEAADAAAANGVLLSQSASDGVVVYSTDGMEELTEEELTPEDFRRRGYARTNLKTGNRISAGDPLYKLVTSDEWSIVFPVTDRQVVRLASRERIKVKFLKDGVSETGKLSIFTVGDERYAKVTFSSGMIRYADERYLEVELVTNTRSGLKIPVSSIVKKDFFTVPASMLVTNEEDSAGFRRETQDKDGKVTTEFLDLTVYARTTPEGAEEEYCYVDTDTLKEGDILVNPETNMRYTVKDTAPLDGVYCVNKGYAVFRTISVIDQNEEYCIVESGTRYGLSQFDYIVLDASAVDEKEITV